MPEQISKYPDVTLQVLRESGAVCGQGAPQNILKPRLNAGSDQGNFLI